MTKLAVGCCLVPCIHQVVGKELVGAMVCLRVVAPQCVWSHTAQQAITGGISSRHLRHGQIEDNTPIGQALESRCIHPFSTIDR